MLCPFANMLAKFEIKQSVHVTVKKKYFHERRTTDVASDDIRYYFFETKKRILKNESLNEWATI